jgi:hypothetical protein
MSDASPTPPFFLFSDMKDSDEDPRVGVSTGERLMAQAPDVYQQIVRLLGQGTGVREIKRLTGCHHRTIQAVSIREGQTIDTMRKELGARALGVASLALESLEEKIMAGSVKPGELAMTVGILVDKGQLLTGGATGRVERVETHQVSKDLDAALSEVETIDAELVTDTGLSGSGNLQIEALGSGPDLGGSDSESDVFGPAAMVSGAGATGSATGGPVPGGTVAGGGSVGFDEAQEGAGGVAISRGGVESHIDKPTGKF